MSDKGFFLIMVIVLFCSLSLIKYAHTIFPFMRDDECFVDEFGTIHNNNCPYKSVPWFTEKLSKYKLIVKKGQEFCNYCFTNDEVEKLWEIHECNIDIEVHRLEGAGASDDYINNRLDKYE